MPLSRPQRIAARLCLATAGLFALFMAAGSIAERQVRSRIDDAAAQVGARVDPVHPPVVTVDLLYRSVRISGLSLVPDPLFTARPITVRGHLDTLQVTGVSLFGLLFRNAFGAHDINLDVHDAWVTMGSDTACIKPADERALDPDAWSIDVGSFHVQLRSLTIVSASGDTIAVHDRGARAAGKELHLRTGTELRSSVRFEQLHMAVDSVNARMAGGYNWSIQRSEVDQEQGTFNVFGARLDPKQDLEQLSAGLRYETDVFQLRLDTVQFFGSDLNKTLAQGSVSVRKVQLTSGDVTVLRDKTLPDGPSVEMPLLARLIRQLPVGSGVDTIEVKRLAARYRERGDRARGYAFIPFSNINALITGARHGTDDTAALVVRARCDAFEGASVSLALRSVVLDTTDRFELDASIGPMPFAALNKATGPLVDIQATAGRMDTVIYHMTADMRHASGVVHMVYRDLKLASGGRRRDETMNRLETILLNSLVRDQNKDRDGTPRDGRFSFARRQDRAIFNYMWSGLREGTKAMLLPDGLVK